MLECVDLTVAFGEAKALDRVSLTVRPGSTMAVMGPSGCGKSTLLRAIAGLQPLDSGAVRWRRHDLTGVPPHRRSFGLMFQDYALFPHLSVERNVAFGLRMRNVETGEIRTKVAKVLELVGLTGFANRSIDDLSGGEQQRVALARTLAPEPELLLLDEPLGSLDRDLRVRLLGEMRDIFAGLDVTVLYVTHDTEEAFGIADDVAVMETGSIAQTGTPEQLWTTPVSAHVARLLGHPNVIRFSDVPQLDVPNPNGLGYVVIPPSAISLGTSEPHNGQIVEVRFAADRYDLSIALGDTSLVTHSDTPVPVGTWVRVSVAASETVPVAGSDAPEA